VKFLARYADGSKGIHISEEYGDIYILKASIPSQLIFSVKKGYTFEVGGKPTAGAPLETWMGHAGQAVFLTTACR
jgi:hypothetical protein